VDVLERSSENLVFVEFASVNWLSAVKLLVLLNPVGRNFSVAV
jgi:hypothetical protein